MEDKSKKYFLRLKTFKKQEHEPHQNLIVKEIPEKHFFVNFYGLAFNSTDLLFCKILWH